MRSVLSQSNLLRRIGHKVASSQTNGDTSRKVPPIIALTAVLPGGLSRDQILSRPRQLSKAAGKRCKSPRGKPGTRVRGYTVYGSP